MAAPVVKFHASDPLPVFSATVTGSVSKTRSSSPSPLMSIRPLEAELVPWLYEAPPAKP